MRTYSGSASGQCLVSFIVSKINIIGSQCFERTLGRGKTHKSIITVNKYTLTDHQRFFLSCFIAVLVTV